MLQLYIWLPLPLSHYSMFELRATCSLVLEAQTPAKVLPVIFTTLCVKTKLMLASLINLMEEIDRACPLGND